MADNSSLLPVLVGGVSTFLGGLISGLLGPLVLGWRKDKSEERNKRREKYEEFVATLYETDHWMRTLYRIRIEQSGESELPPPYAKLEAIQQVYFSDLLPILTALIAASAAYQSVIGQKGAQIQRKKVSLSAEDESELYNYAQQYFHCFLSCIGELQKYAKREFQQGNGPKPPLHVLT